MPNDGQFDAGPLEAVPDMENAPEVSFQVWADVVMRLELPAQHGLCYPVLACRLELLGSTGQHESQSSHAALQCVCPLWRSWKPRGTGIITLG